MFWLTNKKKRRKENKQKHAQLKGQVAGLVPPTHILKLKSFFGKFMGQFHAFFFQP